jgi:molecular chaperone GrpE
MHREENDPQPIDADAETGADTEASDTAAPTADSATQAAGDLDPVERVMGEQRERYLRLAAEYDNYRKRSSRERLEAESRGQADLVKQLLDPLDDLLRFAHVDPTSTDAATVVEGVAMVERKVLKALGNLGLELLNPVDERFDPTVHEALTTEAATSAEDDDKVSRVYQVGYRFNGQLLRPARVVVKQWNG